MNESKYSRGRRICPNKTGYAVSKIFIPWDTKGTGAMYPFGDCTEL